MLKNPLHFEHYVQYHQPVPSQNKMICCSWCHEAMDYGESSVKVGNRYYHNYCFESELTAVRIEEVAKSLTHDLESIRLLLWNPELRHDMGDVTFKSPYGNIEYFADKECWGLSARILYNMDLYSQDVSTIAGIWADINTLISRLNGAIKRSVQSNA